jgi:hypothetical protein
VLMFLCQCMCANVCAGVFLWLCITCLGKDISVEGAQTVAKVLKSQSPIHPKGRQPPARDAVTALDMSGASIAMRSNCNYIKILATYICIDVVPCRHFRSGCRGSGHFLFLIMPGRYYHSFYRDIFSFWISQNQTFSLLLRACFGFRYY